MILRKPLALALAILIVLSLAVGCLAPSTPTPTPVPSPVTLFVEPEAGTEPVVEALRGAESSILMKMYLMTEEEVIAELKDAAARGVSVRVMLEKDPYGSMDNEAVFADLQAAGVEVKWGNPTFRYTHEKSIVVDGRMALIMTLNQTHSAFTRNREYGIVTTDPADVAEVSAFFEADWERAAPQIEEPRLVWSPGNSRERMLALIDGVTESLDLEQLLMQDEEVEEHLISAAERGVKVRVIVPPDIEANQPGLERLREGGVEVRYLAAPSVHAKVIVADGRRALVGSINISTASLDFNRELGIVFEDEEAIATLRATFEGDWKAAGGEAVGEVISWEDAAKYYGKVVTVEGFIVQTKNVACKVIYLNFSPHWQTDLKVVIFPHDAAKFPSPPEEMFLFKKVRVTGVVEEYEGAPEIIVHDPDQIEIVADTLTPQPIGVTPTPTFTPTPTPKPLAPPMPEGAIPWYEAHNYIGQKKTVCGPVVSTKYADRSKGQPTFLNIGKPYPDPERFTVIIWGGNRANFPSPPEEMFLYKKVRVTGVVEEYEGALEIIVHDPSQIEIVE